MGEAADVHIGIAGGTFTMFTRQGDVFNGEVTQGLADDGLHRYVCMVGAMQAVAALGLPPKETVLLITTDSLAFWLELHGVCWWGGRARKLSAQHTRTVLKAFAGTYILWTPKRPEARPHAGWTHYDTWRLRDAATKA